MACIPKARVLELWPPQRRLLRFLGDLSQRLCPLAGSQVSACTKHNSQHRVWFKCHCWAFRPYDQHCRKGWQSKSKISEMVISYFLPSLPDIVELKVHTEIAKLWKKVGGRDPCGSVMTQTFKKRNILRRKTAQPQKRHGESTKYFRRKERFYYNNLLKRGFFERM